MAAHNIAIEIDPPDGAALRHYDLDRDSSRLALFHNFEEERPTTLSISIHKSLQSTLKQTRHCFHHVTSPFQFVISKFKLLFVIACYSVFGAWLFMTLEVPTDLAAKEEAYHTRLIARDVMILNLRAIHQNDKEDREERWKESILAFENDLGLEEPALDTAWTFWMAFLYAGTIYTTIGYGNIACATTAGKVATMLYSLVGIPIMLVILNDLGDFLLVWMKRIANNSSDLMLFVGVRLGLVGLKDGSNQRLRYIFMSRKLATVGLASAASHLSIVMPEEDNTLEEPAPDPPVLSAIAATVAWILLAAAVFCIWEDWTYFTSIYFFFISCSTIGLGDVTPAHPEYMIATFGVVMVGLSLVTVCIDVIREKIELMYMALLKKMLQDYMEAVKNGDPNAAAGMMAGFQGKAKFLMPLISKDRGAKVMSRFKEDCTAKGIDPPAVLVDLDSSTGMPAFANAHKEEFNNFIEQAVEKRAGEEKKEMLRFSQLLEHNAARKSMEHLNSAAPAALRPLQSVDSQTETFEEILEAALMERSACAMKAAPLMTNMVAQTEMVQFKFQSDATVQAGNGGRTQDVSTQCSTKRDETTTGVQTARPQLDPLELMEKDVHKFNESVTRAADVPPLEKTQNSEGLRKDELKETSLEAAEVGSVLMLEVATQSEEVARHSQHCQTKLSSIDTREIVGVRELKRKARLLALTYQRNSLRSSIRTSVSDAGTVSPSGRSQLFKQASAIEEVEALESVELIAEVNVNVSLVRKPVDEHGTEIVDTIDQFKEEDDDVFLSDSDLDDVEQFVVEESTQTDSCTDPGKTQNHAALLQGYSPVDIATQTLPVLANVCDIAPVTSIVDVEPPRTVADFKTQTAALLVQNEFTQTDQAQWRPSNVQESATQTPCPTSRSDEVQAGDTCRGRESVETQTSGSDLNVMPSASLEQPASICTGIQPEASMFVVDKKDQHALEAEHQVRFSINRGTRMDLKHFKSFATQV